VSQPFLAEIVLFAGNFAPRGWAFCNGQILSISQNTALFSLLGTTYGGNGQTTFALPDLRGRVPIHAGGSAGPGLPEFNLGEVGGEPTHTLIQTEMPAHTHAQPATNGEQTTNRPNAAIPAKGGVYANDSDGSTLQPALSAGGSQPHNNLQPYLGLNYIIALEGIFPSRN
jgi:microcystin-dependent protein